MTPNIDAYPVLRQLNLTEVEFVALRTQGFVSCERRQNGTARYKLRFRLAGRQAVKYLGSNSDLAETIRQELALLQEQRHLEVRLKRCVQRARRALRRSKRLTEQSLVDVGYHYHGFAIRRLRTKLPPVVVPTSDSLPEI